MRAQLSCDHSPSCSAAHQSGSPNLAASQVRESKRDLKESPGWKQLAGSQALVPLFTTLTMLSLFSQLVEVKVIFLETLIGGNF